MQVISVKYSDDMSAFARHYHDAHQILYVLSGEILLSVGNEEYSVKAGSLVILSRLEEHAIRVLSSEYKRFTLRISGDTEAKSGKLYLLSSVLTNRSAGFSHVVGTGEKRGIFERLFFEMCEEYQKKEALYSEKLDTLLTELLIELYRYSPEHFVSEVNRQTLLVQAIQRRLEGDCSERHTLSSIASEYHISEFYLSHIFKDITGYSPIDYLMSCRLSAAKKLLSTTDKPIKEIVYSCGFSDESNFSRIFRQRVGITPTDFRKKFGSEGR